MGRGVGWMAGATVGVLVCLGLIGGQPARQVRPAEVAREASAGAAMAGPLPSVPVRVPVRAARRSFAFLVAGADRRVPGAWWNRCEPITVGADFTYARRVGLDPVAESDRFVRVLQELVRHTGYTFEWKGEVRGVREPTGPNGPQLVSDEVDLFLYYGGADAPSRHRYPQLAGQVLGRGGPTSLGSTIVAGSVVYDADDMRRAFPDTYDQPYRDGVWDGAYVLYLHEIGHAMNLAHVDDPGQVMYPQMQRGRHSEYAAGDRAGLRLLAAQPCPAPQAVPA